MILQIIANMLLAKSGNDAILANYRAHKEDPSVPPLTNEDLNALSVHIQRIKEDRGW